MDGLASKGKEQRDVATGEMDMMGNEQSM